MTSTQLQCIFLCCATLILPSFSLAKNLTHSSATVNVSEGDVTSKFNDTEPELAVSGSTIHTLWIAEEPSPRTTAVYYRRSKDNGVTWEKRVRLFADPELETATFYVYKRLVVDANNVVHIGLANYGADSGGWFGQLLYLRSADGGTTWEAPKVISRGDNSYYPYEVRSSTNGSKTTIGIKYQHKFSATVLYRLLTTSDGGKTFAEVTAFTGSESCLVADMKRTLDRAYVL